MSTQIAQETMADTFPSDAVRDSLQAELVQAVLEDSALKGVEVPPSDVDILTLPAQVDSLVVVAILCAIEPIVGFELPETLVRTGGYRSVSTALDHLLPRIEHVWKQRKGVER